MARLYMMGGDKRDLARKHLRRRYHEGVQLAFCYWHCGWTPIQLDRFRRFMEEPDGDTDV